MNKLLFILFIAVWNFSPSSWALSDTDNSMFNSLKNHYSSGRVELTSGIFLIKGLSKDISDSSPKEEQKYKSEFATVSTGTAFLYKGYVLTNYHICRGHEYVYVKDYLNETFKLKVIGYNINQDVCVAEGFKNNDKYLDFENFRSDPDNLIEEKNAFFKEIAKNKKEEYIPQKYMKMYSMWGVFTLTNIEKDTLDDKWSSVKDSMQGLGEKCKGGISGSPVVSTSGFEGMGWAAETASAKQAVEKVFLSGKSTPKLNCFFMTKKAVDEVLSVVIQKSEIAQSK